MLFLQQQKAEENENTYQGLLISFQGQKGFFFFSFVCDRQSIIQGMIYLLLSLSKNFQIREQFMDIFYIIISMLASKMQPLALGILQF